MTCHGAGGSAPRFAYGGTIALGKVGRRHAGVDEGRPDATGEQVRRRYGDYGGRLRLQGRTTTATAPTSAYDDYDDYGSYDAGDDDDDYGYGDDDDDDYGGGSCSKRGCPGPRPRSTKTGVRIVGADGDVFDTVTDGDGNFWFKSKGRREGPRVHRHPVRHLHRDRLDERRRVRLDATSRAAETARGRLWTWDGRRLADVCAIRTIPALSEDPVVAVASDRAIKCGCARRP